MKHTGKKLLSLLVAGLLTVSMLGATTLASAPEGETQAGTITEAAQAEAMNENSEDISENEDINGESEESGESEKSDESEESDESDESDVQDDGETEADEQTKDTVKAAQEAEEVSAAAAFDLADMGVMTVDGAEDADDDSEAQGSYLSYSTQSYVTDAENPESTQTVEVDFVYDAALAIADEEALLNGFSTISLGGSDVKAKTSFELGSDKKTLKVIISGFFATYSGKIAIETETGVLSGIKTEDGADVRFESFATVRNMNMDMTEVSSVTGTADTPASVTVKINNKASVRGMYHILPMTTGADGNTKSVLQPESGAFANIGTATSHAHMFYTMAPATLMAGVVSAVNTAIKNYGNPGSYKAVNNSDGTITFSALNPVAGEVVDLVLYDDDFIKSSGMTLATNVPSVDALPQSDHDYAVNEDKTWTYTLEGAGRIVVTFNEETKTEARYDYIYIYDGNDNEIGKYDGTSLAGKGILIPTETVKIRLTSDRSGNYYGFKVTSIEKYVEGDLSQSIADVKVASSIMLGDDMPLPTVTYNGKILEKDKDYTVDYSDNTAVGTAAVIVTGKGDYFNANSAEFEIADEDNLLAPATVVDGTKINLRANGEVSTGKITMSGLTEGYIQSIEKITLNPINAEGTATVAVKAYPNGPKEIVLTKDDYGTLWTASAENNSITFNRTSENPIVYVMEGHEPIEISSRWGSNVYPQSQIYEITIEAYTYSKTTGTNIYYTGTSPEFSIIIDADGDSATTDDQTVVKSWTSDEITSMSTFANGSSQCGMTGFRTFSTLGVSLVDLLKDAGVEVSASDSFLLDTSDHYGNTFTYQALFDTTRYFLEAIYDDKETIDTYHELVQSDDESGAIAELRSLMATKALEQNSTIEPRICSLYDESLLHSENVGITPLPTESNVTFNKLVGYENQFRFVYGIKLESDDINVNFDTNGGSDIENQLIKGNYMTSTENTTIKSSYWANSLVIYRGAGEAYESSQAEDMLEAPQEPTREGHIFAGWYTTPDCAEGTEYDFSDVNLQVEADENGELNFTLYAKWIIEYEILEGANGTVEQGSGDDLYVRINGAVEDFRNVEVDGEVIDESNYKVSSGSTIVELQPEYIDTLSIGVHTLKFVYADGEANTQFTVTEKKDTTGDPSGDPSGDVSGNASGDVNGNAGGTGNGTGSGKNNSTTGGTGNSPKTGDNSNALLWAMLFVAAAAGCSVVFVAGRNQKKKKHN